MSLPQGSECLESCQTQGASHCPKRLAPSPTVRDKWDHKQQKADILSPDIDTQLPTLCVSPCRRHTYSPKTVCDFGRVVAVEYAAQGNSLGLERSHSRTNFSLQHATRREQLHAKLQSSG